MSDIQVDEKKPIQMKKMLGSDMQVSKYKFNINLLKSDHILFRAYSAKDSISQLSVFMIALNLMVSIQSFIISSYFGIGLFFSLIVIVVCYICSLLSQCLIIRCWVFSSTFNYYGIWRSAFSKSTGFVSVIIIVSSYFSVTIKLLHQTSLFFMSIIDEVWSSAPDLIKGEWFLAFISTLIVTIIIASTTGMITLRIVSILGNLIVVALIIILFISADFNTKRQYSLFSSDFKSCLRLFASSFETFFLQPFLFRFFQKSNHPTLFRVTRTTIFSTSSAFLVFMFIGIIGFFFFSIDQPGKYLFNSLLCRSLLLAKSVIVDAVLFVFIGQNIVDLIHPYASSFISASVCGAIVSCCFSGCFQYFDETFFDVFSGILLIFEISAGFTFPAIFFLKFTGFKLKLWASVCIMLLLISLIGIILSIYFTVKIIQQI